MINQEEVVHQMLTYIEDLYESFYIPPEWAFDNVQLILETSSIIVE